MPDAQQLRRPEVALWCLVAVLGLLTFAMAIVVGTDSLTRVLHPAFVHGVIHEGDHIELHFK